MASAKMRNVYRRNLIVAKRLWLDQINQAQRVSLKSLSVGYGFSIAAGDLQLLDNRWYVTHSGLIRLAQRKGCSGIVVSLMNEFCDLASARWVCKATVYMRNRTKEFAGYGDADPTNVSSMVRGAELRIAETRAVNRALRKAYGIGLCSVEELGALSAQLRASATPAPANGHSSSNGSSNGQPRLRDQLCLLIRQYNLDANLVKTYAADFCGTQTLSGASRELVESFIAHLSSAAKQNRDALICKLNSFSQPVEAGS